MIPLTNAQLRVFKAQAQRLKAILKVGKDGLSPQFLAALDDALKYCELVKVKFDEFKDQKKELAPQLAEKSASHLVTRVQESLRTKNETARIEISWGRDEAPSLNSWLVFDNDIAGQSFLTPLSCISPIGVQRQSA